MSDFSVMIALKIFIDTSKHLFFGQFKLQILTFQTQGLRLYTDTK
jgi:hypothetical protein